MRRSVDLAYAYIKRLPRLSAQLTSRNKDTNQAPLPARCVSEPTPPSAAMFKNSTASLQSHAV
jgi:hypothetical protein